jgi:hypothetical protein
MPFIPSVKNENTLDKTLSEQFIEQFLLFVLDTSFDSSSVNSLASWENWENKNVYIIRLYKVIQLCGADSFESNSFTANISNTLQYLPPSPLPRIQIPFSLMYQNIGRKMEFRRDVWYSSNWNLLCESYVMSFYFEMIQCLFKNAC